jgi:hypothetical protein
MNGGASYVAQVVIGDGDGCGGAQLLQQSDLYAAFGRVRLCSFAPV